MNILNSKIRLLSMSAISLLITIYTIPTTKAVDIPIEAWVSGELSITLNGDWNTGLNFGEIDRTITPGSTSTHWNSEDLIDYISVVDDSTTAGFYITVETTDFAYTGDDPTQQALSATNMTVIGNYNNSTPSEISSGYNDETKELSIMPNSCATATTDKFTWHPDFHDSQKNYTLTASNSPQTIISSTADCTTIINLRFDRSSLFIDGTAAVGSYNSSTLFTIFDGQPL